MNFDQEIELTLGNLGASEIKNTRLGTSYPVCLCSERHIPISVVFPDKLILFCLGNVVLCIYQ